MGAPGSDLWEQLSLQKGSLSLGGSEVQTCLPPNGHPQRQSQGWPGQEGGEGLTGSPRQPQEGAYTCSWRPAGAWGGEALRFRGLSSIFLPDSFILFTSAGLAGQTDSVNQQVSWPTTNCITHPLCVGTILGALGIAGSKQTAPAFRGSHSPRETVSQKLTGKCTKHSAHLSQSWDREQQQKNTEQEVRDAPTLPPEHCEGLSGFRVRGARRPPSTRRAQTRARTHVRAHMRTHTRTRARTYTHAHMRLRATLPSFYFHISRG